MKYVKIRRNNPFQKAIGFGETANGKETIILKNHRLSSMSIEMAHSHTHIRHTVHSVESNLCLQFPHFEELDEVFVSSLSPMSFPNLNHFTTGT